MATPAAALITDEHVLTKLGKMLEDNKTVTAQIAKQAARGEIVDSLLLEKQAKIEADTLALVKSQDEMNTRLTSEMRQIKERISRAPGAGGGFGDGRSRLSIGQQFTQSDEYKNSNFNGRFKVQMSAKGRLWEKAVGTITEEGSGVIIYPRRVGWIQQPQVPLVMRDLLDVIPLTGTNAVEYVIETWTLAADYQVLEGDRKAQSGVLYTDKTAVVRTIAHFVKISRQMLSDVPFVMTTIDQRLVYGVMLKEDKELLYGDGSAGHILGIMPQASAFNPAPPLDTVATTPLDMILAAIVQVTNAGYVPTSIVLNPITWAAIQMEKTTLGMYLLGGPGYGLPQGVAQPSLWGLPVVTSLNMLTTDALVGAFPGNAALFDRESPVVEISYENEDDFVRNLATLRCEERMTLAVFVPAAFVKMAIAVAPPLRQTPPPPPPPVIEDKPGPRR